MEGRDRVWEPMAVSRTRRDVLETVKKKCKKLLASLGPNSVGFSCSVAAMVDLTTTPLCLST